jgi:hypothetical protein
VRPFCESNIRPNSNQCGLNWEGKQTTCEGGECVPIPFECKAPFETCWYVDPYGDPQEQCFDLQVEKEHCGACRAACAWDSQCIEGKCTCANGLAACLYDDPNYPQWSCVDYATDSFNCGACGVVCGQGKSCVDGKCVGCPAAQPDTCWGGCTNLQNDPKHCGYCDVRCADDAVSCTAGECVCAPGKTSCGWNWMDCIDTSSHPWHCGGCFQRVRSFRGHADPVPRR